MSFSTKEFNAVRKYFICIINYYVIDSRGKQCLSNKDKAV